RLLHKLYLPSCVIGGLAGLIIIQTFALLRGHGEVMASLNSAISEISAPWSRIPGLLINVVFACLFLGVKIPKVSLLLKRAGPQLAYGQIVAWGQYVVGLGLWVLFLGQLYPELPSMFAAILPVGFEGGHGTAAAMGPVFVDRGWPEGQDFALASATGGIVSAIVVGMVLINWAVRRGYVQNARKYNEETEDDSIGVIPVDRRPSAGKLTVSSDAIESFTLHIVVVGIAIGLGMLIKYGLAGIEGFSPWPSKHRLLSSFPLFPLCMIGGLIVQFCEQRFDRHDLIDLGLMRRIQNSSLDFLVVAAIAMIKLEVVVAAIVPLLILVVAGILWNVFCVGVLARRMLPDAWFERSIAELGQSMGVTATGLLLLRVVDPDYKTPAADAFACKQIVHEPFMGGGLWTSTVIPLIAIIGATKVLFIALAAMIIWILVIFLPKVLAKFKTSVM
ncbi:MAG: sodium:glutamate symporter, partial [Actinobacteria bacterium]|nr:sodium:glutamate symporter [Actinomycetota bacterium]